MMFHAASQEKIEKRFVVLIRQEPKKNLRVTITLEEHLYKR